jgi:hypothetical protein
VPAGAANCPDTTCQAPSTVPNVRRLVVNDGIHWITSHIDPSEPLRL